MNYDGVHGDAEGFVFLSGEVFCVFVDFAPLGNSSDLRAMTLMSDFSMLTQA